MDQPLTSHPDPMAVTDESLERIGSVLSDVTRWRILFELRKGDALPVGELAKRVGRPPDSVSRHMAYLRRAGLVERVFSTCYKLRDGLRTEEGIDLGPCVLRLVDR